MNVFWSYARNDNQKPAQKVLKLKNAFSIALIEAICKKSCKVFFDMESISWGAHWRMEIKNKIEACDCLIATITPSFYNSRACLFEVQIALEKKRKSTLYTLENVTVKKVLLKRMVKKKKLILNSTKYLRK